MKAEIPYVEVFDDLKEIVGEPEPGTRFYQAYGTEEDYSKWFDAISEISMYQGVYSPVAVARYAQVSRNAVYKRLREGRLTGFQFHTLKTSCSDEKETEGLPTCFIPLTECMAWKDIKNGCSQRELEKYRPKTKYREQIRRLMTDDSADDLFELIGQSRGGDDNEEK